MDPGMTITHGWDWWAYQFRVIHRQGIAGIDTYDDQLVAFIVEVLGLRRGARVLDLGCGSGAHARRLARRGIEVVGLDIATSLVRYCIETSAAEGLHTASFVVGDMRELGDGAGFAAPFDAVVMLSTSFGFFDDATNQRVLERVAHVLRRDGSVLLQVMDPLSFAERQRQGVFQEERPEGSYWTETSFDPATFTSHSRFRFTDAAGVTHLCDEHERIRVYTLPELRTMLRGSGFRALRAYGDSALPPRPYGVGCSRQLIVVGRKCEDQAEADHRSRLPT